MRNFLIITAFYLICLTVQAQIQSYSNTPIDGSITITPDGLKSKKSGNDSDSSNVALGPNTLANTVSSPYNGILNTAVGSSSLQNNTTGSRNTAVGSTSLLHNTYGSRNSAFGVYALGDNTTGSNNTALGSGAMYYNTVGEGNVAVGVDALEGNIDGVYNTVIGTAALITNSSGSNNIAIGLLALENNISGHGNVATGSVALSQNISGGYNTAIGDSALYNNSIGNNNVASGRNALYTNIKGSNHTAIGNQADVTSGFLSNTIAIGFDAKVNFSNKIRMGNTSISAAETQVAWSITSDKRWKEEVKPLPLGLNFINELKPVSYHRKNNEYQDVEFGLIAQELEVTLQKYGFSEEEIGLLNKGPDGYYSVRYNDLFAPLIKALQEQQSMISKQKEELSHYKVALGAILMRVENLEQNESASLK